MSNNKRKEEKKERGGKKRLKWLLDEVFVVHLDNKRIYSLPSNLVKTVIQQNGVIFPSVTLGIHKTGIFIELKIQEYRHISGLFARRSHGEALSICRRALGLKVLS